MGQGREYWSGHVQAWRSGEQTRAAYCEQHDLSYGAMGYWVRKLRREQDGDGAADGALVEIETGASESSAGGRDAGPIEVLVGDRYVVRLWPSVRARDLREVLAALESRR